MEQNSQTTPCWSVLASSVLVTPPTTTTTKNLFFITTNTRVDEPTAFIPTKIYTSLKYQLHHQLNLSCSTSPPIEILLVKLEAVYSTCVSSNQEVQRISSLLDNNSGESKCRTTSKIFQGADTLATMSLNRNTGTLECTTKIKFLETSSKHERKSFCLRCSYYLPGIETPLLILISNPFKVMSRRPDKSLVSLQKIQQQQEEEQQNTSSNLESSNTKKNSKKRCRLVDLNPLSMNSKKHKGDTVVVEQPRANAEVNNIHSIHLFLSKLQELVTLKNQLSDEDSLIANEKIKETLLTAVSSTNAINSTSSTNSSSCTINNLSLEELERDLSLADLFEIDQ